MLAIECAGIVEADDEFMRRQGLCRDPAPVDGKECVGNSKSCTLVAVNERMVLRQAFPKGRGLLD